jgi:hypothetical protein
LLLVEGVSSRACPVESILLIVLLFFAGILGESAEGKAFFVFSSRS